MFRSALMMSAAAMLLLVIPATAQQTEDQSSEPYSVSTPHDAQDAAQPAQSESAVAFPQRSDASEEEAEASSAEDDEYTEYSEEADEIAEYGIEGAVSLQAERDAQAQSTASLDEPMIQPQSSAAIDDSAPQAQPSLRTAMEHPYVAPNFYTVQPTDMRGSDLVGMDVYNANNERIGEVEDIIVDERKNLKALVLGVGGFLGVGERNVVVEPESVLIQKRAPDDERALVHATRENLESAPEFKMAQAGDLSDTSGPQ